MSFPCYNCGRSFSKNFTLWRHRKNVHREDTYTCKKCSLEFKRFDVMRKHRCGPRHSKGLNSSEVNASARPNTTDIPYNRSDVSGYLEQIKHLSEKSGNFESSQDGFGIPFPMDYEPSEKSKSSYGDVDHQSVPGNEEEEGDVSEESAQSDEEVESDTSEGDQSEYDTASECTDSEKYESSGEEEEEGTPIKKYTDEKTLGWPVSRTHSVYLPWKYSEEMQLRRHKRWLKELIWMEYPTVIHNIKHASETKIEAFREIAYNICMGGIPLRFSDLKSLKKRSVGFGYIAAPKRSIAKIRNELLKRGAHFIQILLSTIEPILRKHRL